MAAAEMTGEADFERSSKISADHLQLSNEVPLKVVENLLLLKQVQLKAAF